MNRVQIKLRERIEQSARRATNSPLKQGSSETVTYYVDFSEWGASATYAVTSPVVTILDSNDDDVTSTLSAGGGSVVSDVEVQFDITSVTAGERYRVFVKGTSNSRIQECWCYIDGEL
jgi:hypothetical protein